ncbi:Phd finger protein, partial [Operophtera brumata]
TSDSEPEVLEKKVPRRSRIRYSKDGAIITSPHSPTEPVPVPKYMGQKTMKLETPIKISTAAAQSPIKVTIKPFEFSSENEALVPEMNIKREKKNKKKRDHVSTSEDHKKQHKRSFTSPALTNTPLMSITPIVADSPNDSHNENSNASTSAANQNFQAQNLSFSSLLVDKERDSKTIESSIESTLANLSSDIATYKANRKRRKEKHRNRYSPDLLRSPSKLAMSSFD